ncbi:DUF1116 domain-containing protein [Paenarthrobacter sp. PH39-S1]|uniref:oxamate carbamoyltransferase subunit AllG family protein n=1 Tax=Paenarthrobacter sp. PH39-S1 TaxID=3046204 RepID=UPI0024B927CF|nr:DUF1116 domain-containing protein [Paenarthrobacter sp. PH39-S1]MDJ0358260.1 DUF1116 domain-containing protein [Paenarthrobacter sp. PH39-S1]
MTDRTRAAADAISSTEPIWTMQSTLAAVLAARGVQGKILLHAGPPFKDAGSIPPPVINSLLQAVIFEGWATGAEQAKQLLESGTVRIEPAQDHDCVVPLAGVISPSMAMHVIEDQITGAIAYAVINEGMTGCLRVGIMEQGLVEHQNWLHGPYARWLADRVEDIGPVRLWPVLAQSLHEGDDGHNRTKAGSVLCAQMLLESDDSVFRPQAKQFLEGASAFALNLWMAAAAISLRAAVTAGESDAIVRVGGNGVEFGFQTAARPGVWHVFPAAAPRGPLPASFSGIPVLGAIGDSAVVDFFGLGGQALHHAPTTIQALGDYVPEKMDERPALVMEIAHPHLPIRTGTSATRITQAGTVPVVLLGMIEAQGLEGRIAGGAYEPPIGEFAQVSLGHASTPVG